MSTKITDGIFFLVVVSIVLTGIYLADHSITGVGITLDFAGFILLWRFGLPNDIKINGVVSQAKWDVEVDAKELSRFFLAQKLAHLGIILVLAGLLLQFIDAVNLR